MFDGGKCSCVLLVCTCISICKCTTCLMSDVLYFVQASSPGFPELEELSLAVDGNLSVGMNDSELERILKNSHKLRLLDVRGWVFIIYLILWFILIDALCWVLYFTWYFMIFVFYKLVSINLILLFYIMVWIDFVIWHYIKIFIYFLTFRCLYFDILYRNWH